MKPVAKQGNKTVLQALLGLYSRHSHPWSIPREFYNLQRWLNNARIYSLSSSNTMCAFTSLLIFGGVQAGRFSLEHTYNCLLICPFLCPIHRKCWAIKSKETKAVFFEEAEKVLHNTGLQGAPQSNRADARITAMGSPLPHGTFREQDQDIIGPTCPMQ